MREDFLDNYHHYDNLEYREIGYIDSKGFIQPEVDGDYSELIMLMPPIN